MKITKSRLKQLIKEEISYLNEGDDWHSEEYETMADRKYADRPQEEPASVAGQDTPNEEVYPELLEAVKEVMDLAFGEHNYNIYKELQALAEFHAKGGGSEPASQGNLTPWGTPRATEEESWARVHDFFGKLKGPR